MKTMLYSDRPAKAVQRRMVIDACRRLSAIASLSSYRYVGLGGLEFNDFIDAHNALGITEMTSIEANAGLVHRVEFNKPYEGMQILMGYARDQLTLVDWRAPVIVWLDYMDPLTRDVLRDVEYVISSAQPGSFLIVTVQADLGDSLTGRVEALRMNLDDLAPNGVVATDLHAWGVADLQQRILGEQANLYCRSAHQSDMRQVLDIGYQDSAKMTTWGAVISSPTMDRSVDACRFDDLPFARSFGEAGLRIKVPALTAREWQHLEHAFGNGKNPKFQRPKGIDIQDIREFEAVYRYRVS